MKLNPKNILFGDDEEKKGPVLLAVTPPRAGERTLLGVENMLGSIAVPEPFSLELAADMDGVTLMARCLDDEVVRGQLSAHYPQARIQKVDEEDDPLRLGEGERAWSMTLRADGPEYVPLRTFRDDDLLDPGSDPLIALMGALSALEDDERVVARLLLRSLGPDWSQPHMEKAHKRPGMEPREPAYTFQTKPLQMDGITMAVLGIGALAALKGYLWVQDGEIWKAALLGTGTALGLAAGAGPGTAGRRPASASRTRCSSRRRSPASPSTPSFRSRRSCRRRPGPSGPPSFSVRLPPPTATSTTPPGRASRSAGSGPPRPTRTCCTRQAPDCSAGAASWASARSPACGTRPERATRRPWWSAPARGRFCLRRRASGAARWWETPRRASPGPSASPKTCSAATTSTSPAPAWASPPSCTTSSSTRCGRRPRAGTTDAIVVIDPHTDLVAGILEHVPESLIDRVRLIDLSDETRSPGINLLDTRVFADRDRTADSVVRVAKGLWEQWGPRMQSILEQTVKTLHEANEQVEAERQYTILDGLRLLSNDNVPQLRAEEGLRPLPAGVVGQGLRQLAPPVPAEALAPVQTRLSYYASSKRARAILGQRRSTIDLRRTIHDGGVLLVSTSQGTVGRDVAALVGASLLNLVDAVIREQGRLPLHQRRGALVVVDEMQSMPGVDYESMLSELGKFGASFVLATQSLAKLDDLSRTMRDTLLANVGCLAVFQVAGNDARTLVWELGKDRVSEDDIVSLPVHHCYVRATVGKERMPAFSMMVQQAGGGRTRRRRPHPRRRRPPTPSRPRRSPTATRRAT